MTNKIDIKTVGEFKILEVRDTIIKDGVIGYERRTITPLDDVSEECAEVKAKCEEVHTDEIKVVYQAYLDSLKE